MRDSQHPSHALSPLYKGVSEENVRDEVKNKEHVIKSLNRVYFAIQTWQNRGCVCNYIYLRVVEMPCNIVNDA